MGYYKFYQCKEKDEKESECVSKISSNDLRAATDSWTKRDVRSRGDTAILNASNGAVG